MFDPEEDRNVLSEKLDKEIGVITETADIACLFQEVSVNFGMTGES